MNRRKVGQFFRGPDGAFAFTYDGAWPAWKNTVPVSRSLPLRPHQGFIDTTRAGRDTQNDFRAGPGLELEAFLKSSPT